MLVDFYSMQNNISVFKLTLYAFMLSNQFYGALYGNFLLLQCS